MGVDGPRGPHLANPPHTSLLAIAALDDIRRDDLPLGQRGRRGPVRAAVDGAVRAQRGSGQAQEERADRPAKRTESRRDKCVLR